MRACITLLLLILSQAVSSQMFRTICNDGTKNILRSNYKEAIECFEKAVELAKSSSEKTYAYANLAYSQQMYGDIKKALASYNSAIEHNKEEVTLIQQRANILLQLDSLEKALKDYNFILDKEPNNSGALFFRANVHSELNNIEQAKADYRNLLQLEPKNENVQLGLAMLYKKEEKYNEAITLLSLLIEQNPQRAAYYIARSDVERAMGLTELALFDVDKAISLEPENANHHILQSILYEKLGRNESARRSRLHAEQLKKKE